MKKKLTFLLTTLVLALALCMGAAAAETFQVGGLAQGQTGYLAGYNDDGRMAGVRVLTADGDVAASIPNAAGYKLFRLDEHHAPQGEALAFSQSDGTVRKIDGQVCVCYGDPEGLAVRAPVTEKVTGKVSLFFVNGDLLINGARYSSTTLTVEGCDFWDGSSLADTTTILSVTCDFYLDPDGDICWIDQLTDSKHSICLPVSVTPTEDSLQVTARIGNHTRTLEVTRLDGKAIGDGPECISPADALAQVRADCGGAFYTYSRQAGDGCYHLVRADKDAPVDTGCEWGERYVIFPGSAIQPAADFTFGAIDCLADERTTFWLSVGTPEDKAYLSYRGFQALPYAQAMGCAITRPDGVADLVYLDVPYFTIEPPDGCILVVDNSVQIDPKLLTEEVYQVNIMDTDGASTSMRVSSEIADGIKEDRMESDRFADNTYVGKLFHVIAMDQNGTVWGLRPVETYEVQALADGSVTTAAGSWRYSPETHFIYADFVREISSSELFHLSGHGSFSPNDFCAEDVGEDKLYSSVRAAVIADPNDPGVADYVYVLRECN